MFRAPDPTFVTVSVCGELASRLESEMLADEELVVHVFCSRTLTTVYSTVACKFAPRITVTEVVQTENNGRIGHNNNGRCAAELRQSCECVWLRQRLSELAAASSAAAGGIFPSRGNNGSPHLAVICDPCAEFPSALAQTVPEHLSVTFVLVREKLSQQSYA